MRVKLSKLLSAVLAICIVFVGFTAFAADATVVTTTNYNYATNNPNGDDTVPANATMTVTTTVTEVEEGTEVTYLVSDGTASSNIVYINQATATAEDKVEFEFTANQGRLFACTAKYGSDGGYTMPTFQFNHGVNYMSNGSALVTQDANVWGEDLDGGKVFLGKVSGDVSVYGVEINDVKYPAMGCDDEGNFAILIKGIDTTGAKGFAR